MENVKLNNKELLPTVERNIGLDLLKAVAMFMVVFLHVNGFSTSATSTEAGFYIMRFIRVLFFGAVDVYAIISGYVMFKSKYKYSNIVIHWLQVVLYASLFTIIFAILMPNTFNISKIFNALFPVSSSTYWYFTAYFVVFLMIPLLNLTIEELSKRKMTVIVLTLFVLFCIISFFLRNDSFLLNGGYSPIWILYLYIVGAYLKKCNVENRFRASIWFLIYLACIVVTYLVYFVIEKYSISIFGEQKSGGILIYYTSPTITLGALSLVMCFARLKITKFKKLISLLSSTSFGVYLLHDNPYMSEYGFKQIFSKMPNCHFIVGIILAFAIALGVYLVCSLIEYLRIYIFKKLKIKERVIYLEEKIKNKLVK